MFALALVLSVVGLALGPALVALGRGRALVSAVIEGLTLGLVPLLIVTRLLPHVMEELGPVAVGLAVAGYAVLWLVERRRHDLGDRVGQAVIVPTLALHALSDGAGLSLAFAASRDHGSAGTLVALAIVMHRVPEGLFIATRLLPALGWPRTLGWLALLAGTTVFGALAGHTLLDRVPETLFDSILAFGLGAMLRMVMHAHSPAPITRSARAASGVAFLSGIAVAIAVPSAGSLLNLVEPRELSIAQLAGPLFLQTAPAMLIGLIAAGALRSLLQSRAEGSLQRGSQLSQATRGLVGGLARSSYAGRAVPLLRHLLADGAPPAAAVSILLAGLEIDIAAAALAVPLLGVPLTIARVLAGGAIAVVVALIIARIVGNAGDRPTGAASTTAATAAPTAPTATSTSAPSSPLAVEAHATSLATRILQGVRDGCSTALDHIGAWYLAGLVLAAALEAGLPWKVAAGAGSAVDPILGALLALPVPLSAHAGPPIAAILIHKGLSAGAALALLAAAPGASLAVLSTLRKALGLRAAAAFCAALLACAAVAGLLANSLIPQASIPDLHALAEVRPGVLHLASAGVLTALLVASILRLGPREWLGKMSTDLANPHVGCHSHESPHDHDGPAIHHADASPVPSAK